MAPSWTTTEDRAFLLALVKICMPDGPSKNQYEAANTLLGDRWSASALNQHYNKKLRPLDPLATITEGGSSGDAPTTPARSAPKRKAPTPKTPKVTEAPAPATPEHVKGVSKGGKQKKVPPPPKFPNLKKPLSQEAVVEDDDDDDDEQVAKKAKVETQVEQAEDDQDELGL